MGAVLLARLQKRAVPVQIIIKTARKTLADKVALWM